jgi:hypothetical protein
MDTDEFDRAADELLSRCLMHLDNLLVQSSVPQQIMQARALKAEVLRLQIRLAQRRIKGVGFDDNEAYLLGRFVPVLMATLPPAA